jgi:hypothetical protein
MNCTAAYCLKYIKSNSNYCLVNMQLKNDTSSHLIYLLYLLSISMLPVVCNIITELTSKPNLYP